jgi:hypothetical protein
MIESKLVSARNDIIHELRLNAIHRNPAHKRYLEARKAQLDRDIQALGFSETEIAKNNFDYAGETKSTTSKSYLIPPPSWMKEDKQP